MKKYKERMEVTRMSYRDLSNITKMSFSYINKIFQGIKPLTSELKIKIENAIKQYEKEMLEKLSTYYDNEKEGKKK